MFVFPSFCIRIYLLLHVLYWALEETFLSYSGVDGEFIPRPLA